MRTVPGPTDRVVVVGAGLGGLSAALRLAAAGREVTVVERDRVPGGRCGLLERDGYRFDTGPTVLTLPHLLADALGSVGEDLDDWLTLTRLDPAYRAFYADGSTLDVRATVEDTADGIRALCGDREADGFVRYTRLLERLYRWEMRSFIDRNTDSPLDLVVPDLARLAGVGAFRRLAPFVRRHLRDPRTQRLFSFQSLYAGLSPYDALAVYAVIAYMDSVAGVYAPQGGMHAVPVALAGAAQKHGVTFRYDETVERVVVRHGRAVGVDTTSGFLPADVVVVNADLPVAYRDLLPAEAAPRQLRHLRYSPSCLLLLAGSTASYSRTAHHSIHFGAEWKGVFRDLVDRGRLMADPSLLVSTPTKTDAALAPKGRQSYYVLAPTPNLDAGIDWTAVGPRYRDELVARLEAVGYQGFGDGIEVEHVTTPADWAAQGMERGTPFAASHLFRQTGPFRPGNLAPHVEGVVFTGSGTRPGVGVPMVLVSGRLAAQRVTG